ncbi:MAG: ATP-binding cassette domain-containing protein [Roseburia sp.]|nr:ATP-binding cassette domain-containing protein [Anaeroplasma bactoclasticum]MCM1196283.1 ATP-binding cassette domain-containing protein [Roseburia sp.]MCM1557466.1 ATP-binding cassette domain-containing protein [Anaeroplasma bactoclasticum]
MKWTIKIEDKSFKDLNVFHNCSVEFESGKFYAIKGESGVGKTTLLKMIGLLEPFKGQILLDNNVILSNDLEKYRRQNFTYIFQDFKLIPELTVYENAILPLKNLHESIDMVYIDEICQFLGISSILHKQVLFLSGGEAQRACILRALVTKRPFILADEPTGSLDGKNVEIVMRILKDIKVKYNRTIIMVTHDKNLDNYFDCIYNIEEKKVVPYV